MGRKVCFCAGCLPGFFPVGAHRAARLSRHIVRQIVSKSCGFRFPALCLFHAAELNLRIPELGRESPVYLVYLQGQPYVLRVFSMSGFPIIASISPNVSFGISISISVRASPSSVEADFRQRI